MPNAQQYLNQLNKTQTTQIGAKNQSLSGKLAIHDFLDLEKIDFSNNKDLTSIELINLPNLNHFQVNNCQIDNITVINCPNLSYFNIGNNLLTKTDFLASLNPQNLTYLSIHSNNFAKQKLDFLSQFTNLEELYLDNSNEEKFNKGICNHFYGSLQPLQNLEKLKWLSIAKTDLNSGLEYLPKSLKKIGCKKDWSPQDNSGCTKIYQELEKAAKIKEVTEKLIQEEENEPISVRGKATWYRLAPWCQAHDLLGEKEFKKQISQQSAQEWLDNYYPKKTTNELEKRENITFLNNINGNNLEGNLDLSDFINLQRLNCSNNKLTKLNLNQCKNLTKLDCSNNKFISTDFLKEIPNKEKLEILRINNNEGIKGNLNFLTLFTGMKELDIKDCPLVGSLEPLKNMKNLKKIFISRTHVSKGLEDLPKDFRELYCDSDYQYKSIKIVNELSKFPEDDYYNVARWREDKQNKTVSAVVPLERLFVIRSNIKKFLNKWGLKEELSKLQSPDEFNIYWYTGGVKWLARAGAVTGGILALSDNAVWGGALAAAFPFLEVVASQLEGRLYDSKEKKWEEFKNDTENFLDNYHELLGILEQVKKSKLGLVNQALNDLRTKTKALLNEYDKERGDKKNGIIDIDELTDSESRKKLANDLNKENREKGGGSQLGNIMIAMKKLEEVIIKYRQGDAEKVEEIELEEEIQIVTDNQQDEIQAQQEFPPKSNN